MIEVIYNNRTAKRSGFNSHSLIRMEVSRDCDIRARHLSKQNLPWRRRLALGGEYPYIVFKDLN
jgi:hypothetical protein